ncbi:MAG: L,D-transpeptidase [Gaiellaceae bacterium]
MRSRRALLVLIACALAALVAALGASRLGQTSAARATPVAKVPTHHSPTARSPLARSTKARLARGPVCVRGTSVTLVSGRRAYAVTVRSRAIAYRRPGTDRIAAFGRRNINGVPTVFGVVGARVGAACQATWYRVQLPLRPNGIVGWVRASAVSERTIAMGIVVDLSERRVTLFRGGRPILVVPAAIGSSATPTPTGRYYVNQKLVAPDPWGAFGPVALGISAFSPVLTSWAQGGPIAIHGTNQAELLGSAVSHGCIRVRNSDVLRLYKLAPTGTPVLIRM